MDELEAIFDSNQAAQMVTTDGYPLVVHLARNFSSFHSAMRYNGLVTWLAGNFGVHVGSTTTLEEALEDVNRLTGLNAFTAEWVAVPPGTT